MRRFCQLILGCGEGFLFRSFSLSAGAVSVPFRICEKTGAGFAPSPSPVLVEPVPYLDEEANEGDGEGDFHGDG